MNIFKPSLKQIVKDKMRGVSRPGPYGKIDTYFYMIFKLIQSYNLEHINASNSDSQNLPPPKTPVKLTLSNIENLDQEIPAEDRQEHPHIFQVEKYLKNLDSKYLKNYIFQVKLWKWRQE
jgi:hypothetical protein